MFTREQLKANAVSNLNRIGCYKPYTEAFRNGTLTMYENCGGYYVEDEELLAKIHTIEEKYGGIVYAVIHSMTSFGELYTMLWADGDEDDSEYDVEDYDDGQWLCMAYVWNKTDAECSEFGSVVIRPALGGLLRVY